MMAQSKISVKELGFLPEDSFISHLQDIFEKGKWIAQLLFSRRKQKYFMSSTALLNAFKALIEELDQSQQLKLINSYPDLAGKAHLAGDVTVASREEHSRAGLGSLSEKELEEFKRLNVAYKSKFGFVFILAVRNATKEIILQAFRRRIESTFDAERRECLEQIYKIAWMRILQNMKWNTTSGFLTSHVLDTASGCPAENMRVALHRFNDDGSRKQLGFFYTNSDGRIGNLLEGESFIPGHYELTFFTGSYFVQSGLDVKSVPFLDEIPIRFGIDNPEDHYHVPLLVTPWSFSTYRGS